MTNTETVSTELREMLAEFEADVAYLTAIEVRAGSAPSRQQVDQARADVEAARAKILASSTQAPAEWQVEAALAAAHKMGAVINRPAMLTALRAAAIPAPERSKEEIVGVRSLLDDGVIEAIHSVYQMKVREYDADFRRDTPEGFWQKKYGTNLHSTGLGERWALKEALSQAISALETSPPHKEGARPEAWIADATGGLPMHKRGTTADPETAEYWAQTTTVRPLYAAPVPVPVTSEADGGFWRAPRKFQLGDRVTKTKGSSWTGKVVGFYSTALTPVGYAVESENEPGSVQIYPEAALSVKPGEQG